MKVLVTGHKGFIGQNLQRFIQQHTDWEVRGWEWQRGKLPSVHDLDWVIHLGAISSTTETDVDKILEQNLEFSQKLFKLCQDNSVNLQYASSASVYGLTSNFKEDSAPDPKNPYAWSKYLFDRWVSKQQSSMIVQGFRYFNVYGNHEEHKGDQASPVSKFRWQSRTDQVIKIFENSDQYYRDFIAVEDICDLHIRFINEVAVSGLWNFGTGNPCSFGSIARDIGNRTDAKIQYIPMPENLKNSYQNYTCSDTTKLQSTLTNLKFTTVQQWLSKELC